MIIVVLGILAAIAIPKFSGMTDASRIAATQQEMMALKQAIIGDASVVAGGQLINRGFEGDVGFVPSRLQDLAAKPDSIATYNKLTRLGWNGPYIDDDADLYLADAWEVSYVYQPGNRRLISVSTSDSIFVTF